MDKRRRRERSLRTVTAQALAVFNALALVAALVATFAYDISARPAMLSTFALVPLAAYAVTVKLQSQSSATTALVIIAAVITGYSTLIGLITLGLSTGS